VIEEIIKDRGDSVLTIRFRSYRPPLLLPEHAPPFPIFPTYIAPEHLANSSLPLMLHAVRVEELLRADLPRAPLSSMISRLYPSLITPADLILLLVYPVLVLLCPRKPEDLILR
jgi:hypothetical protein